MKQIFIVTFFLTQSFLFAQSDILDIKIGQMILVGVAEQKLDSSSIILQEIKEGKIGGIILFEKNITPNNSYINLKQITYQLQSYATIPLFIAIDQEGGRVNRLKTKYQFPKSVTAEHLGKLDNIDSTKFYGEITASTLAGLGFNVNFAPVVDLSINPDNPIIAKYGRAFSADATLTAKHASIIVEQHRKYGVVTVLKHFPGHGSSKADTHLGIADVTEYWQEEELQPYQIMIDSGKIDAVMTAHIVNKKLDKKGNPGTLSKKVINDLLREKMGHEGVVFTDDLQMHAITKHFGFEKAIELTLKAGPELEGKIDGMAYRVPVITGSVTDLTAKLEGKASREDVNEAFRQASMSDGLHGILGYSDEPLVSVDYIGNSNSCTIDSLATSAVGEGFVKVVGWYDNEWGYSSRTADLANFMVEKGI